MHARGRLVIVVLLSLILAPWIGAMNPISESDESEHSTPFSELNEAQIDAILSAGAKGVTSWVKQGTANPNAQNGPGDVNSVWISDVVNTTNNAVIIAGSYRGDVIFDNGPSPTERISEQPSWLNWINMVDGLGLSTLVNLQIQLVQHIFSKLQLVLQGFGFVVGFRIPSHLETIL